MQASAFIQAHQAPSIFRRPAAPSSLRHRLALGHSVGTALPSAVAPAESLLPLGLWLTVAWLKRSRCRPSQWQALPHRRSTGIVRSAQEVGGNDASEWPEGQEESTLDFIPANAAPAREVVATKASQSPIDELEAIELIFRNDFPLVMCRGLTSPLILAAQRTVVSAGARLITEGEKGQYIFAIAAGTCQVLGSGCEVRAYGPGSVFGELPLLTRAPHTMSYIAQTDMVIYKIEYKHVQLELRRRRGIDPYGFAADVEKHLADRGVSVTTNQMVDRSPEYLWQGRLRKLQTQVRRTPWHGVCGAYIMLSAFVACAILPFSPSTLPAWWTSSVALASAWVALSGGKPERRFYFQGLGTEDAFASGIAAQLFYSYMIIRCSWDNMGLALPNYLESPWMHAVDFAVAFATVVRVLNWNAVSDPNLANSVNNVGILLTPVWWAVFFLKPAWLSATLDENVTYNLLLAFMVQVGGNAGPFFLSTLEARGFITNDQDILVGLFFGLGVANWPVIVAVVCNWPVVFELLTFTAWLDYPLFGV